MNASPDPKDPWPTEINARDEGRSLHVSFDNGESYDLTAELLRVESPSAEVQGHSPEQKRTVTGKKNVRIKAMQPAGNYAVMIKFDDGHDTGLFSWEYLYEMGTHQEALWQAYLDRLAEEGLSRD
ncbi:MAG: hypothetical protein C0605_07260 [Hyphomicrobiales bacterium]|nr:MAG: hypothetical protein C0605_07260 [Hyphomicrobiales bacterium]